MFRAVPPVPVLVSLRIKALPVPAFVKAKEVAVPELVDSSYKVKARLRPVVVVMVLPALYACCNVSVKALALQVAIWLELFWQRIVVPVVPRVATCVRLLRTICPVPFGERVKSS